jgi:GntR family transcriptional regulator
MPPSATNAGGTAPVIQLDDASATPKYQQIVDQVRRLVATGVLAAGAPLPSVRQLASDLGINVNTVLVAYRALEAENIVLVRRGARAVVHPRLARPAPLRADDVGRIRTALERVRTDALLLGMPLDHLRTLADDVFAE